MPDIFQRHAHTGGGLLRRQAGLQKTPRHHGHVLPHLDEIAILVVQPQQALAPGLFMHGLAEFHPRQPSHTPIRRPDGFEIRRKKRFDLSNQGIYNPLIHNTLQIELLVLH